MSGTSYLRSRQRRWTMTDIVAVKAKMTGDWPWLKDGAAPIVAPVELKPQANREPFGGFSFTLPWAPSVNSAYYNKSNGEGRGKTKKATLYTQAVGISLLAQKVPCIHLAHPLSIHVIQHASADRGDCDNGLKVLIDSLKVNGVIADDNRSIVKRVCVEDGSRVAKGDEYVEVRIGCFLSTGKG